MNSVSNIIQGVASIMRFIVDAAKLIRKRRLERKERKAQKRKGYTDTRTQVGRSSKKGS